MKWSSVLLGALLCADIGAMALVLQASREVVEFGESGTIGVAVSSFKDLSDRFTILAEQKGAPYAFEVLRRATLPPNTDLHLLGHVVGDALYRQKGPAGIAYCTQEFRNACSHSVVVGMLGEYGVTDATLDKIDDACKDAPGGLGAYTMCYHGLGHGVFAYFGYDLSKTVAFCKKTGSPEYKNEQFFQCVGGAVMELMGGGGHDRAAWLAARGRYLAKDNPVALCVSSIIPGEVQGACLAYLTPELLVSGGSDLASPDPRLFPQAFSYCGTIPKSKQTLRDSCFGGFGKEFVPLAGERDIRSVDQYADEAYATSAMWCTLAGVRDGVEACIREALQSVMWGGENDPHASFRFCANAPQDLQDICYDELAKGIVRYLPGRPDLCSLLPRPHRPLCAA